MTVTKYYGAQSDLSLQDSIEKIKFTLKLSNFTFDAEDTWEYACCKTALYSLNITKTEDFCTINSWMKKAPLDINYQIIFSTDSRDSENLCRAIEDCMFHVFGKSFAKYDE